MAIALTKFRAYGEYNTDTTVVKGIQCAKFVITAAAADVDYDINDFTGNFWTAVSATDVGAGVKAWMRSHYLGLEALVAVEGDFVETYLRAAAAGVGAYTQAVTSALPDVQFNAADGPTSMVLILKWSLADGQTPLTANFG